MNTLYAHDGYLNTFMRMRTAAAQRAGPTELLGVGALPRPAAVDRLGVGVSRAAEGGGAAARGAAAASERSEGAPS